MTVGVEAVEVQWHSGGTNVDLELPFAAERERYFHSHILVCVFPAASTSNSNTPATWLSRAKAGEEVAKIRQPR